MWIPFAIPIVLILFFGLKSRIGRMAALYILGYLMAPVLCCIAVCGPVERMITPTHEYKDYAQDIIERDSNAVRDMEALGYPLPPKGDEGSGYTEERKAWVAVYYDELLPHRKVQERVSRRVNEIRRELSPLNGGTDTRKSPHP